MAEAAATCVHRSMAGFIGPADIFRNKNALFRVFQPTEGNESPFDIVLGSKGKDFALQTMQFKLGLYEHQSASAIDGLVKLLHAHSEILL
jgi:2-methylcitrate dehydratase